MINSNVSMVRAPVSYREITDAFEYFIEKVRPIAGGAGLNTVALSAESYLNVALKLTEIYVNNATSVSAEKGDVLGHGLYLGVKDSLDSIAQALETKNER